MTIEDFIKGVLWVMLLLVLLLIIPTIIIGAVNTLLEGYLYIKHDLFTYLSTYVVLIILMVRVKFGH
jgi:hypothetical protein